MGNGGYRDAGPEKWFLLRDGKQHGPLSEHELWELQNSGRIRPSDLLWRGGWSDWAAAHKVLSSWSEASRQNPSSSTTNRLQSSIAIKALCILGLASMGTGLIFTSVQAAIGGLLVTGAFLLFRMWFPPRYLVGHPMCTTEFPVPRA
jgi:hypothetical protein